MKNRIAIAALAFALATEACEQPTDMGALPLPDVTGTWVSEGPKALHAAADTSSADSVWISLESLGAFVHGRWREPYEDLVFDYVVTGNLSYAEGDMFTLILEYDSLQRGKCRLWGVLSDGFWTSSGSSKHWPAYESKRVCADTYEFEETLFFIRLTP